jgi:hypothetical protein
VYYLWQAYVCVCDLTVVLLCGVNKKKDDIVTRRSAAHSPPPGPRSFYLVQSLIQNPNGSMHAARYDFDEDGNRNAILSSPAQPSPHQKLLSSMVLGDGSFEASMKERSRVSFPRKVLQVIFNFNIICSSPQSSCDIVHS